MFVCTRVCECEFVSTSSIFFRNGRINGINPICDGTNARSDYTRAVERACRAFFWPHKYAMLTRARLSLSGCACVRNVCMYVWCRFVRIISTCECGCVCVMCACVDPFFGCIKYLNCSSKVIRRAALLNSGTYRASRVSVRLFCECCATRGVLRGALLSLCLCVCVFAMV